MLGRHRKALADLNLLFRHGKVGKTYWGVVEGGPEANEGRIDLPLGRLDDTRGWWMKHDPNGLPSPTTWKVLGRAEGMTWLALEPLTGRTHQLRVHCCEMGWPMLGDNIYGTAPRAGGPGLHLHARDDRGAALQEPPAGPGHGAGAAAHDRAAEGMRLAEASARLVDRFLDPLRIGAVVLVAADLALGDLGQDLARRRQA